MSWYCHDNPRYRECDMDELTVTVTELTEEKVKELVEEHHPRGVNLGDAGVEAFVNASSQQIRGLGGRRFLLTWVGGKIPRAADVIGHRVGWTQNGVVLADTGKEIGTYDRLVECGGESGREQMMVIYLYPDMAEVE